MTRINCIPVTELSTKHLIAEYRELPRILNMKKPKMPIPKAYCLGKGHMTFFYNKLGYICDRFNELVAEMLRRGFTVNYSSPLTPPPDDSRLYYWQPTPEAQALNRQRIKERLNK